MEYKVDVSQIIEKPEEKMAISDAIEMEPMKVSGEAVIIEDEVSFEVWLSNVGLGILIEGESQGKAKMVCSRCLDDFLYEMEGKISDLYIFEEPSQEEDVEEKVYHVVGSRIDIYPPIRDSVGLALPLRPLDKPDCRGLCPVCGTNLNYETCEHQAGNRG